MSDRGPYPLPPSTLWAPGRSPVMDTERDRTVQDDLDRKKLILWRQGQLIAACPYKQPGWRPKA